MHENSNAKILKSRIMYSGFAQGTRLVAEVPGMLASVIDCDNTEHQPHTSPALSSHADLHNETHRWFYDSLTTKKTASEVL